MVTKLFLHFAANATLEHYDSFDLSSPTTVWILSFFFPFLGFELYVNCLLSPAYLFSCAGDRNSIRHRSVWLDHLLAFGWICTGLCLLSLKPPSSQILEQNRDMAELERRRSDGGGSQTWSSQMAVERQPSDAIVPPPSPPLLFDQILLKSFFCSSSTQQTPQMPPRPPPPTPHCLETPESVASTKCSKERKGTTAASSWKNTFF